MQLVMRIKEQAGNKAGLGALAYIVDSCDLLRKACFIIPKHKQAKKCSAHWQGLHCRCQVR